MIPFIVNDGGRAAAGFRGKTGDCVTRAIAIATQLPYRQVYDDINDLAKLERFRKKGRTRSTARNGVWRRTYERYLVQLGWEWVTCVTIGSGCQVHLTAHELPMGRLVVRVSRHMTAVVDRVLYDAYDCSRDGTRCVYGYFRKPD